MSMASSSIVPSASDMVELYANGVGIPLLFPIDENGFASIFSVHLSIMFLLQDNTIWVEHEIHDSATYLLSLTMRENSRVANNGSSVWELCAGKYMVYMLPDSCTHVSREIRTPPHSSSSTLNIPPVVKVKVEPGLHTVIHLSNSSVGDEPPLSIIILKPSLSSLNSPFLTPLLYALNIYVLFLHPLPNPAFPFFNVYVL